MADRKTERLMNLVFTLLATERYLSKDELRTAIADYREQSDTAFERAFERDKNELRELGIDIDLGSHDPLNSHQGYRLERSEVELPQIDLTVEEGALIGLAAQLWDHSGMSREATTALAKLKSIGNDFDPSSLRMAEPHLTASEPSFDAIFNATSKRIALKFSYETRDGSNSERHLQPWGMISYRDRWYVGGFDTDRNGPRLFRLSRILGEVTNDGEPDGFEVPEDADLGQLAQALYPSEANRTAILHVTAGRGQGLRRHALSVSRPREGIDELEVAFAEVADLADEVVSYGASVTVIEPPELRAAVLDRLRKIVGLAK
ncbi:MAG TPA: WYL domain-containing protein [Aeromicrobium sp.]|nr:WYL domain-containing protein [Aeromicrobium sp.]